MPLSVVTIVVFSILGVCCVCETACNLPEVREEIEHDERMRRRIERLTMD